MTDRDALLAAVLAAPDDDLPRLVYADWLDEHARFLPDHADRATAADRAAFIRLQIEAARAEPYSPAWRAATAAADQLLAERDPWWRLHLPPSVTAVGFARGFVERVTLEPAAFVRRGEELFATDPIREVWLDGGGRGDADPFDPTGLDRLGDAFDAPAFGRVRSLTVGPNLVGPSTDLDDLVRSPCLAGLADLSLRANPIPPDWAAEFLSGGWLTGLAGLDLADMPHLGPAVADALAWADHRRFARFDLSGMVLRSRELQRVLESRALAEVEELRLRSADPRNPGPASLLDLGWLVPWGRLRVLDLAGQGVATEGCREIARTPEARELRWLGLAANGLDPEALRLLVESPHLHLYHLDVRGNGLGPREVERLRRRFPEAVVEA